MLTFLSDTLFAILPKGTVRDEGTFLILVAILAGLIVVAYLMRKRRNRLSE